MKYSFRVHLSVGSFPPLISSLRAHALPEHGLGKPSRCRLPRVLGEALERDLVAFVEGVAVILEPVLRAELAHAVAGGAEVVPWEPRKQVVDDLVLEASVNPVVEAAASV